MRSIYILVLVLGMAPGCIPASPPIHVEPMATPTPPVLMVVTTVTSTSKVPEVAPSTGEPRFPVLSEPILPEKEPFEGAHDREKAIAWMMGFMTRNAPPGRQTFYKEAKESKEEALTRYQEIAESIVDVVYESTTKPLFLGPHGRARTVSVILSIMLHESGFMKNVDFGVGKYGRGDHGNSWCMLQINVGNGRTLKWNAKEDRVPAYGDDPDDITQGNTGPELVADRHACIREGLRKMRVSFTACASKPLEERLNVFASGKCEEGAEESRIRMNTAFKFWDNTKTERTFSDAAIVAYMAQLHGVQPIIALH